MSKSFICAKLPAASWWRYDYNWILACRCLQASAFIKHEVWCRLSIVCLSCIKHDISYCQKVAL